MKTVTSIDELKTIYDHVVPSAIDKVTQSLTSRYRQMIEASPFMALATVGPEGLDCSPRGDEKAVVRVDDEKTVLLPDWRGNNRVDSLMNIVRDPRVALMFLIPGSNTVMRINGRAVVAIEPALLASFEMNGKHPRSVVVVTIDEVYFQCARAVLRADLWNGARHVDPAELPSPGEMAKEASTAFFDAEKYDREWPERAAKTMW